MPGPGTTAKACGFPVTSAAPVDHPQSVGCVVEGVEQGVVVQAGQGIDRVEAVLQEGFDRGFGGTETWHGDDL